MLTIYTYKKYGQTLVITLENALNEKQIGLDKKNKS